MKVATIHWVVAAAILLSVPALAGVPHLIDYQGVLSDLSGQPLGGQHDLAFRIYADTEPSSAPLWTEIHEGILVQDGHFDLILGGITIIPDELFASGDRWMGISVDSDPEIAPRMRLTSTPWALRAAVADSASIVNESDPQVGQNTIVNRLAKWNGSALVTGCIADTDNGIGIGTDSPILPLDVNSDLGLQVRSQEWPEYGRLRIIPHSPSHFSNELWADKDEVIVLSPSRGDGSASVIIKGGLDVGGAAECDNQLSIQGGYTSGSISRLGWAMICNAWWFPAQDGGFYLGNSNHRWEAVYSINGTINTSDARLKENITDLTYGLDEIMRLHPVSFTWRDHPEEGRKLGLVAQEVQPVIREVVADVDADPVARPDESGTGSISANTLGLYYSSLIPVLVKAVQEQQSIIQKQEERIRQLEVGISRLEGR